MRTSSVCCRRDVRPQDQERLDARISQSSIAPLYNRKAAVYDWWGILTETRARKRALELADIQDGQRILEVAVGTGLAFREIVKRNPHGTNFGIDISPGMLSKARKRMQGLSEGNYTLSEGTALRLDAEDESFHTLVNNYMFDLTEFKTMGAILTEFNRVLEKGGKLILVNMTLGERFGSRFYDWIYQISPQTMGGCRGVRMAEMLPQYGFKVELREYHQQLRFPSEVILALKSGPAFESNRPQGGVKTNPAT